MFIPFKGRKQMKFFFSYLIHDMTKIFCWKIGEVKSEIEYMKGKDKIKNEKEKKSQSFDIIEQLMFGISKILFRIN